MADDGDKTEEATEHRIQQARREGRVVSSKELVAALALLVGAFTALKAVPWAAESVVNLFKVTMQRAATGEFSTRDVPQLLFACAAAMLPATLIVLVPSWLMALFAGSAVTGFNYTTDALDVKLERLDPVGAFQQQFLSATPWVQLVKGLAVVVVMGWSVWGSLTSHMDVLPAVATWTVGGQASFLKEVAVDMLKRALPAALTIGALDYVYQRWHYGEQMMMSKQEVKQEHKEQDGDPMIKARRRARARQIAFSTQIRDVAKADVVVTNPTHYAVALRYRKEENAAPIVLARGVDNLAAMIRAEATRHDVAIIENRPLARALYAKGKVGRAIPKDYFGPVAQVLAAVYRRRRAAAAASAATHAPAAPAGRPTTPVMRAAPKGVGTAAKGAGARPVQRATPSPSPQGAPPGER